MSVRSMRLEAHAFWGFAERQFNLYRRYWAWEVVWVVYSLVSVLSIGYLAQSLSAGSSGLDVRQTRLYLLIGALLWTYLSLVFIEISAAITWERWEGTIEYTFMAPVRRTTHLLGICVFAIVYGLLRAAVVTAIALPLFQLDLTRADLGAATAVLAVSMLPLIGLGVLTSVLPLLSPEKGEQMTVAVQGMILLVSGVYYPLSVLPGPLQLVGEVSPLTYTLSGVRASLLQGPPPARGAAHHGHPPRNGRSADPGRAGAVRLGRAPSEAPRAGQ
ncbi:MAG: ABC transporter permease, partial [Candidatus Dormibacteraeota bacterium]|nr:ABC transporter permease [Candidatus Dormibacteraeota bacterium]